MSRLLLCLAFLSVFSAEPIRKPANPARLMDAPGFGFWAGAENPFGMPGLYYGASAIHFPLRSAQAGAGVILFSVDSIYQEGVIFTAGALSFSKVDLGTSLRFLYSTAGPGFGNGMAPAVDVGVAFRRVPGIALGFAAENLWASSPYSELPAPAAIYTLDFEFSKLRRLKSYLGVEYEKGFPAALVFEQQLRLFDALVLKAGFRSEPLRFSVGVGVYFGQWRAEAGVTTHPELGMSNGAAMGFESKQ